MGKPLRFWLGRESTTVWAKAVKWIVDDHLLRDVGGVLSALNALLNVLLIGEQTAARHVLGDDGLDEVFARGSMYRAHQQAVARTGKVLTA